MYTYVYICSHICICLPILRSRIPTTAIVSYTADTPQVDIGNCVGPYIGSKCPKQGTSKSVGISHGLWLWGAGIGRVQVFDGKRRISALQSALATVVGSLKAFCSRQAARSHQVKSKSYMLQSILCTA